jgi:hypothetical protein
LFDGGHPVLPKFPRRSPHSFYTGYTGHQAGSHIKKQFMDYNPVHGAKPAPVPESAGAYGTKGK